MIQWVLSSCRWKYEGPSDSFKALMDMAAVHSSCRLCIHLATKIHDEEEKSAAFQNRPCHCTSSSGTVYHLFVRERGRFKMESIYLRYMFIWLIILSYRSLLWYGGAGPGLFSSIGYFKLLFHCYDMVCWSLLSFTFCITYYTECKYCCCCMSGTSNIWLWLLILTTPTPISVLTSMWFMCLG